MHLICFQFNNDFFKCKAIQICTHQWFASLLVFFYRIFVFFFSVSMWLGEVCFPNNPPIDMLDCHEKRTWKNLKSNHI